MTTKQPKPLTTQKIQAVLRKADFLSVSAGCGEGYSVSPRPGITGQWIVKPLGMPLDEKQALLDNYTAALAAAGLNAVVEEIRGGHDVVVTDPTQFTPDSRNTTSESAHNPFTMGDAEWFEVQARNARGNTEANPGTHLAVVETMKAERFSRAAAALRQAPQPWAAGEKQSAETHNR